MTDTVLLMHDGLNVIRFYGILAVIVGLLVIGITQCWFWNSNVNACPGQCMFLSRLSTHPLYKVV